MKVLEENFQVVHFSTGHAGGAGLAARRLNAELNMSGVDSSFFAIQRKSYVPNYNEFSIKRSITRKLVSIILLKLQENFSRQILFSTFSSNAKGYRYFKKFQNSPRTILHFHNWANLISERNLLRLCGDGVNIVITAHDERIATGGCHYKFDCEQISCGCTSCPLVSGELQRRLIRSSRRRKDKFLGENQISPWIISPSMWVQNEVRRAGIFHDNKLISIPNTLGPQWNRGQYVKNNVEGDKKVLIGIASMSTTSFVKAGDVVTKILNSQRIKENQIEFLVLNQIPDQDQFKKFWQEIDCLLALTRADNSPNVIWEALSLKIPVISVGLGGIPEIGCRDGIFLLAQAEDAPSFLEDSSDRGAKGFIRNAKFGKSNTAQNIGEIHKNLYLQILSQDLIGENKL